MKKLNEGKNSRNIYEIKVKTKQLSNYMELSKETRKAASKLRSSKKYERSIEEMNEYDDNDHNLMVNTYIV